jgi:hypothetical protein
MRTDPAPAANEDRSYSYRPSLLGGAWEFRLTDRGIDWSAGQRSGHVAWRDIRRVRMSFRPVSMQSQRYLTEIWATGAPKLEIVSSSWKSMVEQERLDAPYSAFIAELHRCLAQANSSAHFVQGSHPLLYWPGLVIFASVGLGLAALFVRTLQAKTLGGAAFVGFFLALFLWQGGNFFRRNRPGVYRADAPPPELMPGRRANGAPLTLSI